MANPRDQSRAAVAVTNVETNVLTAGSSGLGIQGVGRWGCAIKNVGGGSADSCTIKVYKAWGDAVGLTEITELRTSLSSGAVVTLEFPFETAKTIRITATASTTDTTVSIDFAGRAS